MGTRKFDASDSGGCFKRESEPAAENERKKSRKEKKKRKRNDGLPTV
jgi:hypothetical protein